MVVERAFAGTSLIGGAGAGTGAEAARVDIVIGRRGGPLETAWATALATPRAGHRVFVAELRPGLPVRPATLVAGTADVTSEQHEHLLTGPAQAAVAGAIARAVEEGLIPREAAGDLLVIAAVWVDPAASEADDVFANHLAATFDAVAAAVGGTPTVDEVLAEARHPWNAHYHRHRN